MYFHFLFHLKIISLVSISLENYFLCLTIYNNRIPLFERATGIYNTFFQTNLNRRKQQSIFWNILRCKYEKNVEECRFSRPPASIIKNVETSERMTEKMYLPNVCRQVSWKCLSLMPVYFPLIPFSPETSLPNQNKGSATRPEVHQIYTSRTVYGKLIRIDLSRSAGCCWNKFDKILEWWNSNLSF